MFITSVWVMSINLYYAFTLRPRLHNNGDIKKRYCLIADITMTHLWGLRPCNLLHPRLRCLCLARLPAKKIQINRIRRKFEFSCYYFGSICLRGREKKLANTIVSLGYGGTDSLQHEFKTYLTGPSVSKLLQPCVRLIYCQKPYVFTKQKSQPC